MAQKIHITGVVQGVGFRPFVYGLAIQLGLRGWVVNTSGGVEILVEGKSSNIERFVKLLSSEKPLLAKIDSIQLENVEQAGENLTSFEILESESIIGAYQPISVDAAICPDCERELFDPTDRRYLYPFINCTNCGPRFTIIKDIPYDRPMTTMAGFQLCVQCRSEYENPLDRRFHAQPVACPQCGPFMELRKAGTGNLDSRVEAPSRDSRISTIDLRTSAILKTRRLLREGHIVAIKGLGGFHLACDAANPYAVDELRRRKGRAEKPFALMAADLYTIKSICEINDDECSLLTGHQKPIVLLAKKTLKASEPPRVCDAIAPNMDTLGIMLPYTPLHHLLLNQTDPVLRKEPAPPVLVMTSGNFSEEPIAIENKDALERLAPLADAFLLHNRDIHIRCDDSVVRVERRTLNVQHQATFDVRPETVFLRRSRGYAPYPVQLSFEIKPTLAVGGELKNTFCLARDHYAFLSHYIGDMENVETYESFERGVAHLSHMFRCQPEVIAHDLHPNYFTTHYAQKLDMQRIAVQHHHAHIASCMADNSLDNKQLIGLSFDGTGYGTDGATWGGEVLLASYLNCERFAHLEYLPLPGSDSAIRHPWRIAVGYAHALGIEIGDLPFLKKIGKQVIKVVQQQVDKKFNTPLTSSMGRLFDAVASLIGIRNDVTYEAQAAIEMEVLSRPFVSSAKPYPYLIEACHPERSEGSLADSLVTSFSQSGPTLIIHLKELLNTVIADVRTNTSVGMIGARFHKTIAAVAIDVCKQAHVKTNLNEVALSGGVWQNQILLNLICDGLEGEGFVVYFHKQVPTNDGGLALGQAVIANFQSMNREER